MRSRFLTSIVALAALFAFSRAIFAQTTPSPDPKAANQAIYSGKHHEGSVPPHDISGVWMVSEDFRFSPIHEAPNTFLQPWAVAKLNAEPLSLRKDLPGGHAGGGTAQKKPREKIYRKKDE